jgi:8-oxo-dGTP pyrophosphatase MutT (NUDIX family)
MSEIRPLVICLFRNGDRIFVAECYDPSTQEAFYRPLGGAIKFGETSQAALMREIKEELGADIANLQYLGTLENIFTFNGELGHEIVLVYDGEFIDKSLYHQERVEGYEEEDGDIPFQAIWVSLTELFGEHSPPLYPDGLMQLIGEYPKEQDFRKDSTDHVRKIHTDR